MTARPAGSPSMTAARPRRPAPRRTCSLTRDGAPLPFARAVLSGRATGVPGVVRMLDVAHRAHGRLPWSGLFGDAERTARGGFVVSPRLGRMIAARNPQNGAPDVLAYFAEGRRHLARSGRHAPQPGLCRFPPPSRRGGARRPLSRPDRRTDRRSRPRRRVARVDDAGRSRRLPPGRARTALPDLSRHPDLRAAAAVERRRRAAAAGDPRAHRHRRARARRPAGLVPVRRGQPPHVRRPRSICRRSGLRHGAGRGAARSRLCRVASPADRRAGRPAAAAGHAARRAGGRRRCDARAGRDQPFRDRRCRGKCRLDDDDGRNRSSAPGGWSTASSSTTR